MNKILVVEDDNFLANAYRIKLTKVGFEVVVAVDGVEALEKIKSQNFDLVILDLIIPKIDGFAVLTEIRSQEKYKKLPILVASNLSQMEDINRALKLGANDFIVKSDTSLDALIEKIKKLIPQNDNQ
jgi:DNA-binding response OmpR family regulator